MKTFFISLFALLFITQCFAQTTLSTEDCEVFYQNAFYAEILPSLRQMRKDLEKDENFDASDSLVCVLGYLNKCKYQDTEPVVTSLDDCFTDSKNVILYTTEFCGQKFDKKVEM